MRRAWGAREATSVAISMASSISRPGSTTRLTRPQSIAVFASSTRAVNSISAARA